RRHDFRTAFVRAPDLLRVRMYAGFAAAWSGWRRNLAGIFGERPASAAGLALLLTVPTLGMLVAGLRGAWPAFWLLWAGAAAASASARLGGVHSPWWALAAPVDALLLAVLLALGVSDYRGGRLARWKGREVPVNAEPRASAQETAEGSGAANVAR